MPPINLFKDSAINANIASAVTSQSENPQHGTASAATTTSQAAPPYPAARPGVAAVPAPTAAAQRFAPAAIQPTPTRTSEQPFPASPQPGAVSLPPNTPRNIPPPPKAGQTTTPQPTSSHPPPQMSIPPPTTGYLPPTSSTSTTTVPSSSYPVSLPTSQYENGRQSLEGPPGYTQNPYASDLTPDQRRAQDTLQSDRGSEGTDGPSVWDTARQWAQKAGEKISEAESEVWKRVNK